MRRFLLSLLVALGVFNAAQAEVWQARYGVAETFNFKLYNADGTLDIDEVDGGTEVSLSCNEGTEATATNDFVDEGTFYSIALTATELQCKRVAVVVAATTTEVFFIQTINNASAMTPLHDANVTQYGGAAGTFASGRPEVNTTHWHGSDLLTGTGPLAGLGVIDRGTAQSDSTTALQLRSAAAFADNELIGKTGLIYSATTGAGQSGTFSGYAGGTDTATFSSALVTDPTGAVRYEVFGTAAVSGGGGGGASAADVWAYGTRTVSSATNITSTGGTIPITSSRVDSSVGAYQTGLAPLQPTVAGRTVDVTAGGNVGIDWANVESPTAALGLTGTTISISQQVASVAGAVGSVAGAVTVGTNNDKTGYALSAAGLNGIRDLVVDDMGNMTWGCLTSAMAAVMAGDVTTAGTASTFRESTGVEVRVTSSQPTSGNRTVTITCPTY